MGLVTQITAVAAVDLEEIEAGMRTNKVKKKKNLEKIFFSKSKKNFFFFLAPILLAILAIYTSTQSRLVLAINLFLSIYLLYQPRGGFHFFYEKVQLIASLREMDMGLVIDDIQNNGHSSVQRSLP